MYSYFYKECILYSISITVKKAYLESNVAQFLLILSYNTSKYIDEWSQDSQEFATRNCTNYY